MKILLALDTSQSGNIALEETAERPWPAGSSIEVVSVIEPTHLWTTSEVAKEAADRAQEVVRQAVAHLKSNDLSATGAVLYGDPKRQILDHAASLAADLIIVGARGFSPVNRLLVGNVAGAVLRHARCSVAIMRSRALRNEGGFKILLAVDGWEFSAQAARSIADRPWPAGTEVRILSAVQIALPTTRALFEIPFIENETVENARAEAMKRSLDAIDDATKAISAVGLPVSDSVSVLLEDPGEIVLNEASNWGADLIVLGSHGRHGTDLFLLGSVSEAVAIHADCSVEVIRAV